MIRTLLRRTAAIEQQHDPDTGRLLPTVVDDDTPQAEIDAMRAAGADVYRLCEFVEIAI